MLTGKKIIIAGGTGFIGRAMVARWAQDNELIILSRGKEHDSAHANGVGISSSVQFVTWDAQTTGPWTDVLKSADVLINLCGKSVNCRYTAANKRAILQSRVHATNVLGAAVRACTRPPKLWINASSATIYRHAEDRPQDEASGAMSNDFSVQVCKAWESAFDAHLLPYTRKATLRTAIVLGHGGVLTPFRRLVMAGLGGRQGSGKQMFSWIHIDDLCRIAEWIESTPEASGTYNASAPCPVPNEVFMHTLREALHYPAGLPAPAWMLRLGALLIGTEAELLLKSRWVIPTRLLAEGFKFQHSTIQRALESLFEDKTLIHSRVPANT